VSDDVQPILAIREDGLDGSAGLGQGGSEIKKGFATAADDRILELFLGQALLERFPAGGAGLDFHCLAIDFDLHFVFSSIGIIYFGPACRAPAGHAHGLQSGR
jgi:hypothetical protein